MALKDFPADGGEVQSFDILVIGGGLAGVCAAVQAARLGRTVALVQDRPVLGGNSSSEIRVNVSGSDCSGGSFTRFSRETGIIDELALEVFRRSAGEVTAHCQKDWVNYEWVVREPNVTLWLNTKATQAVLAADGSIRGVVAVQTSVERSLALSGRLVIDCSGDGQIAADAGAEFRMGREAASEFNESLAPDEADERTMGSSIIFYARDTGRPAPFAPPPFARRFESEKDLPFRVPKLEFPDSRFDGTGWWWLEYGGQVDTIHDNEAIRDELIAVLFGLWDFVKNRSDYGMDNYALDWIGAVPGKRESRRFMGDCILTENDARVCRRFEDAVGYSGWPIDVHPPGGIYDSAPPSTHEYRTDFVTVPLRCLYSRNVPNLFFAGRNISVTHIALGTTRVMATCAALGQAAGAAAHLCLAHDVSPRELAKEHVREVQQLLLKHDAYIPDVRNEDDADLARQAAASASSEATLALDDDPSATEDVALERPLGTVIPVSDMSVQALELLLENLGNTDTKMTISVISAAHVNDVPNGEEAARAEAVVRAKTREWVRFDLGATVEPGRLYWIKAEPAEGVAWVARRQGLPGTARSAWREETPNWRATKGAFCVRVFPESRPFGATNVLSGVARPADWTNLWMSDPREPLPQTLSLEWDAPQEMNALCLSFDDDLDRNIYQPRAWGGTLGDMTIPTLVKDYRVEVCAGGAWREVAHVEGNYQRRNVVRFETQAVEAARVEVLATWGDPSARVYEVRAYRE